MTKIGITGANGLIGSLLKKKLIKKKISYSIFKGDIKNKREIDKWIKNNSRIEYLFHLAALSSPQMVDRNKNEALKVNVYGTKNLLEVLEKRGKKNLVFFPEHVSCV